MIELENIGYCAHKFLTGSRKGETCLTYNCCIHDEYNCNLAHYLGLPKFFNFASKKIKKGEYFTLVSILEEASSYNKEQIANIFKHILYKFDELHSKKIKEIFIIYIFIFLDTSQSIKHLISCFALKESFNSKIIYFSQKINGSSPQFTKYIINNFEPNKRFASIKKNKAYRKKMIRIYILTVVFINKWYLSTIEKLYKPGGKEYINIKNDFETKLCL